MSVNISKWTLAFRFFQHATPLQSLPIAWASLLAYPAAYCNLQPWNPSSYITLSFWLHQSLGPGCPFWLAAPLLLSLSLFLLTWPRSIWPCSLWTLSDVCASAPFCFLPHIYNTPSPPFYLGTVMSFLFPLFIQQAFFVSSQESEEEAGHFYYLSMALSFYVCLAENMTNS